MPRVLDEETQQRGLWYHELRHRQSGPSIWVEVHLLFPKGSLIEEAHRKATEIEAAIKKRFTLPVNITTHLEPREEHDEIHQQLKSARE